MVAEIVGPDDGAVDRVFKPLVYARARLPYLLLVDRHAPFASASMVINGRYHEYARAVGPDELALRGAVPAPPPTAREVSPCTSLGRSSLRR